MRSVSKFASPGSILQYPKLTFKQVSNFKELIIISSEENISTYNFYKPCC